MFGNLRIVGRAATATPSLTPTRHCGNVILKNERHILAIRDR